MILTIQSSAAATLPFGSLSVGPINITGNIAPQLSLVNLASGFNSITVPSGAIGVIITPPTTNAVALTLKGVTGDTGISIPAAATSLVTFGTTPSTIGITAASATTGNTQFIFF